MILNNILTLDEIRTMVILTSFAEPDGQPDEVKSLIYKLRGLVSKSGTDDDGHDLYGTEVFEIDFVDE